MKKLFPFAARLEAQVRLEGEALSAQAPAELKPVLDAFGKFQAEFELMLDRAQYTDVDTGRYPAVDSDVLLGPDSGWQVSAGRLGAAGDGAVPGLTVLWMLHTMAEKTGQFYQQAAANSAHPATRLFLGSLAEVKGMLRRRLDGQLRVLYNAAWGEVGFAPFMLGKD